VRRLEQLHLAPDRQVVGLSGDDVLFDGSLGMNSVKALRAGISRRAKSPPK
jgi:hypothetical protein